MELTLEAVYRNYVSGARGERAPLLFVGHGNPMYAVTDSPYGEVWRELGEKLPKPKAIVVISAHWLTNGIAVTVMKDPQTIHDFYGFPEEMYQISYDAKGSEKVARDIIELLPSVKPDMEWGLDHGTWSVLRHMYPDADVPVLQLSVDFSQSRRAQYDAMKALRPLREKGIMFMGSGNIVHNLREVSRIGVHDWAKEFDTQSQELIAAGEDDKLLDVEALGEAAQRSVPTDDHYRPMLNVLGLRYPDEVPVFFNHGIDLGAVSMTSFVYTKNT